MRNLIRADLRRILHKKALWIILVLSIIVFAGAGVYQAIVNWNSFAFVYQMYENIGVADLLFGIFMFLAVYGDEFKSMAMTTVIGRGLSRNKVIYAKVIDCTILTLAFYTVLFFVALGIGMVLEAGLGRDDIGLLIITFLYSAYSTLGFVVIASLFMYITGNIPMSVFIFLLLQMVVPILDIIAEASPLISKYRIDRYTFGGIASSGFSDIILGLNGMGTFVLILGLVVYIGGVIALTIGIFGKRELEF